MRDIYYAEQQIVKALPTMIEKATNSQLKTGLESHLVETRNHVRRVEQVFRCIASKRRRGIARHRRDHNRSQ